MINYSIDRMISVAIAMSTGKNISALLDLILKEAMDITNCDAGTVYIREKDGLHFHNMVTLSKGFHGAMEGIEDILPPVPLNRSHVCACAVLDQKKINIEDIYLSETYDFSGAARYDKLNKYRTKSMMVIPMEDEKKRVIGVLQLINALDGEGNIIPFDPEQEKIISALSSLAAITLNNNQLTKAVYDLLHSFVTVMVDAVEARSPYNAHHTRSMVQYAEKFIDWLNSVNSEWKIPQEERDPFLMSVWLHDIGKLVTPLNIMDKATRLGDLEERVKNRLDTADLMERLRALEYPEEAEDAAAMREKLSRASELIRKANTAVILEDETVASLREAAGIQCLRADGAKGPLLLENELEALTVRRGTLTAGERKEIERHVEYTWSLLSKMSFEGDYEKVPSWAAMHHEMLNGSGYPEHLHADRIPKEVRLITILDIYDALTGKRPYKPPMAPEKAFEILEDMCREGKLDRMILEEFKSSGAWKRD